MPFWVERNDQGWHTLIIGPDVGSRRHSVELEGGKSLEFPFRLNSKGTMRLVASYWPGSRLELDCTAPPKGAKKVKSTTFSVE